MKIDNLQLITDYLSRNADRYGAKTALVTDTRTFTWAELESEVTRRTPYFKSAGERQAVYAILMPNNWEFVVTYLAIIKAGQIALPLDVIYKSLELNAIINNMKPVLTVCDASTIGRIDTDNKILFQDIKGNDEYRRPETADGEMIADLVFTSGTTGKPKTVPHTHASHIWNIKVCSEAWEWDQDDTVLLSLRLSHWYGLCMGLSGVIYHANTCYLQENFDPTETLKTIERHKITHFTHTPLAYARLLEADGDYDLSSLRLPVSGSAALPPKIWQQLKDRFGLEVIETYGSSETGRIASNRYDDRQPGTPGFLLRDVHIRLGPKGELYVKSPGLFPGYYKNPAETRRNLDAQGYWLTGDTAELKEGRIYLKGRLQESIRKYGYSVSPRDVEWALGNNHAIKESLVMGKAQAGQDSEIIYFVVSRKDEADVRRFAKQELPSIWRPDRIIMLSELPRRPNGKVDLPALKAMI